MGVTSFSTTLLQVLLRLSRVLLHLPVEMGSRLLVRASHFMMEMEAGSRMAYSRPDTSLWWPIGSR